MTTPLRLVREPTEAAAVTLQLPGGADLAVTGPVVIRVEAFGRVQVEPEGLPVADRTPEKQQPIAVTNTTQDHSRALTGSAFRPDVTTMLTTKSPAPKEAARCERAWMRMNHRPN